MERKPLTNEEMVTQLSEKVKTSKIYKAQADEHRKEEIAKSIQCQIEALEMSFSTGRIQLKDTDAVKAQTINFLQACQNSGTIPTVAGLAVALGLSRNAIYDYMRSQPSSETTKFLESYQSMSASILMQQGLSRNTDQAVTIFLLKNSGQGLADRVEIQATAVNDEPELTAAQIAEKYKYVVSDFEMDPEILEPTN